MQKKVYNVTYTTSYTYNLAGEVVNMTYPSGRVVQHSYDVIGRLSTVANTSPISINWVSSVAYNVASQVTGFTYGNGATASFGYSADRHQLTSLSYTKGSTLLSLSYSYSQSGSNNGQIAGITDNVASGRTVAYTYDHLHRLKTAVTNGGGNYAKWGLEWTYDRYGNRTVQSGTHGAPPTNTVSVSTSTNQITGLGAYTFYYDSNGNLTQDDLYKYKYDAENRLVELRNLSDTLLATYAYDGNSLRIAKVVSGWRTWYIYAGTKLISEYEDSASATYSSPTSPGGVSQYTTELYQHSDHLSTRFTTDNSGLTGNQQGHYPLGEVWYTSGQADPSVRRKFTAYMQDDEAATGKINYAYFRQHSARLSRFLRPDPVFGNMGNPQRLNRYSYVAGDPIGRMDPDGREFIAIEDPRAYGPGLRTGFDTFSQGSAGSFGSSWACGDFGGFWWDSMGCGGGNGSFMNSYRDCNLDYILCMEKARTEWTACTGAAWATKQILYGYCDLLVLAGLNPITWYARIECLWAADDVERAKLLECNSQRARREAQCAADKELCLAGVKI